MCVGMWLAVRTRQVSQFPTKYATRTTASSKILNLFSNISTHHREPCSTIECCQHFQSSTISSVDRTRPTYLLYYSSTTIITLSFAGKQHRESAGGTTTSTTIYIMIHQVVKDRPSCNSFVNSDLKQNWYNQISRKYWHKQLSIATATYPNNRMQDIVVVVVVVDTNILHNAGVLFYWEHPSNFVLVVAMMEMNKSRGQSSGRRSCL